ncbi:hypothetical protein BOO86_08780 [Mycobacterium sp. CBMA 234]|uniref:hypothetical protein n=1 Tax=Mycolicibacterium sp. CBMA 234 TaxID=1918495 RepID=UPI0012DDCBC9|nr:hypothetical protein [Mycolicibacterium sp. CBMA 234]MUL64553.1 hypothetical protein [Mycolicibacterium sp. CBMA 234]
MPVPPYEVPVNTTGQLVMTILVVGALLVAAVSAVRMSRSLSSWGPVATLAGSLIAGSIEPIYCMSMHMWYYTPGQWNMYTAFGQSQPIWSWLSYGAFYGGLTLLIWWRVERGATASSVWRLAGVLVAIGIATEIVCIQLGTYEYYGAQPFRVASFPLWIAVANSAIGIVGGIIAARLRPVLTGPQAWAMVVLVPAVMPAIQIGTNFLALDVMSNAKPSPVLMYTAAIVSMAMSITTIYIAIKSLPTRTARTADGPAQRVTAV